MHRGGKAIVSSAVGQVLAQSSLVPLFVALLVTLLGRRIASDRGTATWAAFALGFAYLAAFWLMAGPPGLPPIGAIDKLVYLGFAGAALGGLLGLLGLRPQVPVLFWALATVGWIAWPLLLGLLGGPLVEVALVAALCLLIAQRLARAQPGPALTMSLIAGLAGAGVAVTGASLQMGQLLGALAAGLAGIGLAGLIGGGPIWGAALLFAAVGLLCGAGALLAFYSASEPLALGLLVAIFLAEGVVAAVSGGRSGSGTAGRVLRALAITLAAALPAVAAVVVAVALSGGASAY